MKKLSEMNMSKKMNKNYVLYMMAGIGSRFNADKPKQFVMVKGKPVFLHFLNAIERFSLVTGVIIVCQKDWINFTEELVKQCGLSKVIDIVPGGDTRSQSVKNGLYRLKQFANNDDIVLIHDASHPFIDKERTVQLIEEIELSGAGSLANYVLDTAYIKDGDNKLQANIDRKTIAIGASPEGFKFGLLYKIFSSSSDEYLNSRTSLGALMADNNIKMTFVETKYPPIKITYQTDLKIYEELFDYLNGD